MKLKLAFLLISVFFFNSGRAQFSGTQNVWSSSAQSNIRPAQDLVGSVYSVFSFSSPTDFDPGDGEAILQTNSAYNFAVVKLDANGLFQWAFQISGSQPITVSSIAITYDQKLVIAGIFSGTVDLDPSLGDSWFTSVGVRDIYLSSFDLNGQFLSSMVLQGPGSVGEPSISIDKYANLYLVVTAFSTMNFDIESGEQEGDPEAMFHFFMAKYTSSFEFVWIKEIGLTNWSGLTLRSFESDIEGNTYWSGEYWGEVSFDISSGIIDASYSPSVIDANGNPFTKACVFKLDSLGNLIWLKETGEGWGVTIFKLIFDSSGQLWMSGYSDEDMVLQTGELVQLSLNNGFICLLNNTSGNFLNVIVLNGQFNDFIVTEDKFWVCGSVNYTQLDVDVKDSEFILENFGASDIYITSYDLNFNLVNVNHLGGNSFQFGNFLLPSIETDVWVFGRFLGELVAINDPVSLNITGVLSAQVFMLEITECQVPIGPFSVEGDSYLCINDSQFFYLENNDGLLDYRWEIREGNDDSFETSEAVEPLEIALFVPDTLLILFRGYNACGAAEEILSFELIGVESPELTLSTNVLSPVCPDSEVVIYAESEDEVLFFTDGSFSIGIPSEISETTNFTVTAISNYNCTSQLDITVEVFSLPETTLVITPSTSICQGSEVSVAFIEDQNYSYITNFNNGETFIANQSEMFELTFLDENGCLNYESQILTVNPLPIIDQQPTSVSIFEGETMFFEVVCSPLNVQYNWETANNSGWFSLVTSNFYSGANTSILSASSLLNMDGASYRCKINLGMCEVLSEVAILDVEPLLSTEQIDEMHQVNLWPNPVTERLTIEVPITLQGLKAFVYNSVGNLVESTEIYSERSTINVSQLESGFYFVKIESRPDMFLSFCKL